MNINLKFDEEKSMYLKQICYLTGYESDELLYMFLEDNFFNADENIFLKFKKLETPEVLFFQFKKGLKEIGLKLQDVANYFNVTNSTVTKAFNGQKNIIHKNILSSYELVLKEVFLNKYEKIGLNFLQAQKINFEMIEISFIGFALANCHKYSSYKFYSDISKTDKEFLLMVLRIIKTINFENDEKFVFLSIYMTFNNMLARL